MFDKEFLKALLIVLISLLILTIIFIIIYPSLKARLFRKKYLEIYGRKIYKYANKEDYYLINKLSLESDDGSRIDIDHLLGGNKYIYVIKDRYYEGALEAKASDNSWIYYERKGRKNYLKKKIDNPVLLNELRVKKLCEITALDPTLFISVVLINNEVGINEDFSLEKDNSYIVSRNRFNKLINNLEKRNVSDINQRDLKNAVNDIAHLNLNKK